MEEEVRMWAGAALGAVWSADQTSLPPCTEASEAGSLTGQPPRAAQVPAHKQPLSLYWPLPKDYQTDIRI